MSTRIVTTVVAICLTILFVADVAGQGPLRKRLMPGSKPSASTRPSAMPGGRIVNGTKSAVAGAYDRLTFWDNKKPQRKSNEFIEGTGRFFRPDLAQKEKDAKRFSFVRPASWFEAEPEPSPGPQTVHDWIGQPRPGVD